MGRFIHAAAALLAVVMISGCTTGGAGGRAIEGPVLAVVSYSPDEVILVEPDTLAVIDRVRLRSMGTDPLALPERRMFVTAQCGGLGDDADDSIALVDLAHGGRVRYVELPEPNPGFVESAGDGTVLVSHGVWDPGGIPVTRVDIATGAVLGRERIANAYGALVGAAGALWTVGPEGEDVNDPDYTVRRTSFNLVTSDVFPVDGGETVIAPDGESAETLLLATSRAGVARVSRVLATTFETLASSTVGGLRIGVSEIISVGDLLVLRDSGGEDMSDPGGPLIVLDRATLRELRRIDTGGSVASIAGLGGVVYAVTWDTGELIEVDPAAGGILRRVRLEGLEGKMLQLAAMDASGPPSGP